MNQIVNVNDRRAVTLIEVLVASALMVLLTGIVVVSMIVHARTAYANLNQERVTESARRLIQNISADMADSQSFQVQTGSSNGDTLTILKPDNTFVSYRYVQAASYPNSIGENVIVKNLQSSPAVTTGTVICRLVSPVGKLPVFAKDSQVSTLLNIHARLGDRSNPSTNVDDLWTGRGFQSFLLNTSVARR